MTHPYTKLADALDNTTSRATSLTPDQRMEIYEAARILRAAASVDVAGLMAMAKKVRDAGYSAGFDQAMSVTSAETEAFAALESALRMALAQRVPQDYVLQLLVAAGHVTQAKVDQAIAIAAAAPKGTP